MTTWIDLEAVMLSEINQINKRIKIPYDLSHMLNIKKNKQPPPEKLNIPNKNKHVDTENRVVVTRGEEKEGDMDKESTV